MGSTAAEMFKPRALLYLLVVLLVCLVQTTESKTKPDDKTKFVIKPNLKAYQQYLFERLSGGVRAILATIREGKPGLCTTCWYKTAFYNCTDITPSNLARCRREACPRCRYDERCTHDWCGPPPTTSTTTISTTTAKTTVTTTPDTTSTTVTTTLDDTNSTTETTMADSDAGVTVTEEPHYIFES